MAVNVKAMVGAYMCTETSATLGLCVHFVDKERRCTCGAVGCSCRHVEAEAELSWSKTSSTVGKSVVASVP